MKYLSAPVGAIVRVWFPESEAVLVPGPKLRPCIVLAECRRQFKIDHLCQLNFDQGSKAGCLAPGCG